MFEILVGKNAVIEALKADRTLQKISLEESLKGDGRLAEIVRLARLKGITINYIPRQALDREANYEVHQGVVAHASLQVRLTSADLLAISIQKNEPAFYIVLDGIEDPQNLGAIMRTAEATGVHGVITRKRRAVGLTPAVVKAAAGAVEYMPLVQVPNIPQTVDLLKKKGVWVVGIDMSGKEDYTEIDYTLPTAIVIGAEGEGITTLVKSKCDFLASIPMRGKLTSLNASVATAVVLYEAVKQRMRKN